MKVKEIEFITSLDETSHLDFSMERAKSEVVFVWRSNVWKSSILNSIFAKKNFVKTSSKPWKTRTANIFLMNRKINVVDLPWYWFAKVSKEDAQRLDKLICDYVSALWRDIKKVVMLVDSKIWPQKIDIEMFLYFKELWLNVVIVMSKIDKLKANELAKSIKNTQNIFPGHDIIPYSSVKQDTRDKLVNFLFSDLV